MDSPNKFRETAKELYRMMIAVWIIIGVITVILVYLMADPNISAFRAKKAAEEYVTIPEVNETELSEEDYNKIENGIHLRTGFVEGEGLMLVVNNCTNCHSSKLVTQNRMSKERWLATIRWMQETQNLWDLGGNEEAIVNYLATYYAPTKKGRRQNIAAVEWYELK